MKRKFFSVALVCTLAASMTLPSCIGSFALTNKLLDWNNSIDNKFVNEVVFFAFLVVPVYEVAALADVLVINSIEFWSGTSPVASNTQIIEGNDGKYLVTTDESGYTIKSLDNGQEIRLNYDAPSQTWSVVGQSGQEYPLMTFVDDSHMKVATPDGEMMLIERSQAGLMAYQQALIDGMSVLAAR